MIRYKLTDRDGYTRRGKSNETKWGPGVTHTANGTGGLCTDGVIHSYASPLLAVLMNPIHMDIESPRLWEAECDSLVEDDGMKGGSRSLTTIREIDVPEVTTEQRVRFAILCALEVYSEPGFVTWANAWLDGIDRSKAAAAAWAAAAAARAAEAAARAASASAIAERAHAGAEA